MCHSAVDDLFFSFVIVPSTHRIYIDCHSENRFILHFICSLGKLQVAHTVLPATLSLPQLIIQNITLGEVLSI